MWETIKTNVIWPLVGRIGTGTATVLVGYGVNADHAAQVGIGVTAAGLIAFDLAISYLNRKRTRGL